MELVPKLTAVDRTWASQQHTLLHLRHAKMQCTVVMGEQLKTLRNAHVACKSWRPDAK